MELHFGLLSAVEKLMYLQDCGFGEMFVTISSMSAIVRPLSSVSFHVHLQVVSTSDHVDLQTLQEKIFVQHLHLSALSPEIRPLPSVRFQVHLQVVSTRKRFST